MTAADQGNVELSRSGTFEVEDLNGSTQTVLSSTPTVHYDTAPELTLEQANSQVDPTNNDSIDFTLSGNEDLDGASIDASDFDVTNGSVAGITGSNDEFNVEVTADADGDVSIVPSDTFEVDDTNGNFAATTATVIDGTVHYDSTAPTATIETRPANPSRDATPTFDFHADEDDVTYECRVYSTGDTPPSFDPCPDPYTSPFLSEDDYTLDVKATDAAGNTGAEATWTWTIEPSGIIGGGEMIYSTRGTTPVEYRIIAEDDQPGALSYTFLNSTGGGSSSPFTLQEDGGTATFTPGDGFVGSDTLTVRVRNTVTNAFTDVIATVVISPVSRFLSGPGVGPTPALTNDSTPTFTFAGVTGPTPAAAPGVTFSCWVDDISQGAGACNSGSFTTASLTDGPHTFKIRALKTGANEPLAQAKEVTFTVDTTNPDIPTDVTGPTGLTNDNNATWTYQVPEGVAECRLISTADPTPAFEDCPSPETRNGLDDDAYMFEVRTKDDAGNVSAAVQVGPLLIDTVVEVHIDIFSVPADGNLDGHPTIEFSSPEDPDVTYTCRVFPKNADEGDKPAFAACDSGDQLPLLTQNTRYRFEVKGEDLAGNTYVAPAEWDQENTTPTILAAPDVEVEAGQDTPVDLAGDDADSDALTYEITVAPEGGSFGPIDHGTGQVTFTADGDAAGVKTFEYTVSDGRENGTETGTGTIRIKPDTVFTSEPPAITNNQTPTWEFASPAASVDTFECDLDDADLWEDCSTGVFTPVTPLSPGVHKLEVRAVQGALTDPIPASSTIEVDIADPDVPGVTLTPDLLSNDAEPVFEFGTSDGTDTYECSIDGGSFEDCESGVPFGPFTDGEHSFSVRSVDLAGNRSAATADFVWEVDVTNPAISLGGQPVNVKNGPGQGKETNAKRPVWYFERSDLNLDATKVRCKVDAQAWLETCLSPFQPKPSINLADGLHTLHIEAEDHAGNTGKLEIEFRVNTVGPSVVLSESPGSPSGPTAEFVFSSSTSLGAEGGFLCRITLNGGSPGPWEACSSPHTLSGLSSGNRTLQIKAFDSAGNESTGSQIASHSWTTIGGVPDTAITGTSKSGSSATFSFQSPGNPLATFACSLDGGSFTPCTSPKAYSGLSLAAHTFQVRASNAAGTTDPTPASHEWTAAAIALPVTTLTKHPAASTTAKSASFEFSADIGVTGYECSIDDAAFAACTSPVALTDLALGTHTFKARAISTQGTGAATTHSWTVVAPEAPSVTISKKPAASTTAKSASFEFSSTFAVTGFECSVDDAAFAACTSPVALSNLAVGSHTFRVKAIGEQATAGAVESVTWTIVAPQAPEAIITKSPPASTTSKTADFEFTSSSAAAGFECRLDNAAFAACTSPKSFSGLATGAHTFQVRAIGEQSSTGTVASHNWTVAAEQAPETSIIRQPAAKTATTEATFEFTSSEAGSTFECRIDGGDWGACESPKTVTGLTVGSHTFDVRAKGSGGLTDASPASVTWEITKGTIDDPIPPVCNPIDEKVVVTKSAKLGKNLLVSARISHRAARPGQLVLINLKGGKKKQKAFSKSLKKVVVLSGGKKIAVIRGKSWSASFTVTESQGKKITLKFVRKKGKAIKRVAAFTVKPACEQ